MSNSQFGPELERMMEVETRKFKGSGGPGIGVNLVDVPYTAPNPTKPTNLVEVGNPSADDLNRNCTIDYRELYVIKQVHDDIPLVNILMGYIKLANSWRKRTIALAEQMALNSGQQFVPPPPEPSGMGCYSVTQAYEELTNKTSQIQEAADPMYSDENEQLTLNRWMVYTAHHIINHYNSHISLFPNKDYDNYKGYYIHICEYLKSLNILHYFMDNWTSFPHKVTPPDPIEYRNEAIVILTNLTTVK